VSNAIIWPKSLRREHQTQPWTKNSNR
jgi:hypothetical protein